MESILVLGPGCQRCKQLKQNVDRAVELLSLAVEVEHVTDVCKIMEYDILLTPALLVDGKAVVTGSVPSVDELQLMLTSIANK